MKKQDLPKIIPIFPLSNFIIFPDTTVPLNIFEPRYIEMINDSIKSDKFIGMIQPKPPKKVSGDLPQLHNIGCLGKIISFKKTDDGKYLIDLQGLIRFKIIKEINSDRKYRQCEISYDDFLHDLSEKKEDLKFTDLELIFKNLKSLFDQNQKSTYRIDINGTLNVSIVNLKLWLHSNKAKHLLVVGKDEIIKNENLDRFLGKLNELKL